MILAIGSVYIDTNFLNVDSQNEDFLRIDKEYISSKYEIVLGGSVVNFVRQIQKLGMNTGLIGKVGNDDMGQKLIEMLKKENIDPNLIKMGKGLQTAINIGLIMRHNGENIQIVSGNSNQSISLDDINFESMIWNDVNLVYLGGYFKQDNLYKNYPELLRKIKEKGAVTFLDHGKFPKNVLANKIAKLFESMRYVDYYFGNQQEIMDLTEKSSIEEAAKFVMNLGVKNVIVKQGAKGATVYTNLTSQYIEPIKLKSVENTIGAGDSFNAGFVFATANGDDAMTAAHKANMVAAYKVEHNLLENFDVIEKWYKSID